MQLASGEPPAFALYTYMHIYIHHISVSWYEFESFDHGPSRMDQKWDPPHARWFREMRLALW